MILSAPDRSAWHDSSRVCTSTSTVTLCPLRVIAERAALMAAAVAI
jgi:hypothetical protein